MVDRATRIAYLVCVRQWWWLALLNLATIIAFFVTGHRWWALGWAAGYAFYFAVTVKVWPVDQQIQRRERYVGHHAKP